MLLLRGYDQWHDLDADTLKKGSPIVPLSLFFWIHFGHIEFHGKTYENGVGDYLFV